MIANNASGQQLAEAAASLVGTKFRLHGRHPERGLDCVGLVHASLQAIGGKPIAPHGYRLRNADTAGWQKFAGISGLSRASGPTTCGDVLMIAPGPRQQHLVIVESAGVVIHAHAGLRRVVRQAMAIPPDPLAHWRLL